MRELFSNLGAGTVPSGGTDAPAAGTVQVWTVNVTVPFPAVSAAAGTYFHVNEPGTGEMIRVTACPGGVGAQSWTVTRGAENTVPVAHVGGFSVEQPVTANWLGNAGVGAGYLAPAGAIAETWPRNRSNAPSQTAKTSGVLYLSAIELPARATISTITFASAAGGGASAPTHWWYALLDSAFNLLATTADQLTAAWGGGAAMPLGIAAAAGGPASTFMTTYVGLHYVGLMMAATTVVTTVRASGNVQAGLLGLPPYLYGPSDTGLTGPPAFPHTAAALAAGGAGSPDWAYVS